MNTIEIRHNRKTMIAMIVGATVALIVTVYYIYFAQKFGDNNIIKWINVVLAICLVYCIYFVSKKLVQNKPVITLTKNEIVFHSKTNTVSCPWSKITDWHVKKYGRSHYLIIEAAGLKRSFNISWLDKKPIEIELLLIEYKKTDA